MERIAARLWHPNHEQLEHDKLHQTEEEIRQEITSHMDSITSTTHVFTV